MASSVSNPVMNPGASGYYNQQLGLNLQAYGNTQNAYTQAQQNASSQLEGIYSGYGALSKSVLGALGVQGGGWGVAAPAAQQIERQYTASQGQNQQALISAGLGNSTLLSNVMNQGNLQAAQAYGGLGAQLAQTAAGYESQIGMAGLGARQQGVGQQLGLASSYMGDISHFNFAPNVPLYGQASAGSNPGGYGGGSSGYNAPGGASSAVGATGAYGFGAGQAGMGMGYAGAYGGYNPYAGNQGPHFGAPEQMLDYSSQFNPGEQLVPNDYFGDFGGGGEF